MRLYYGAADATPIRLIAQTDGAFPDAFKIYKGGILLAIGREPQSAAASRALEERLATPQSKVELVFVDANVSVFSPSEMWLGLRQGATRYTVGTTQWVRPTAHVEPLLLQR
jgi:hypothetical protein